MFAIESGTDVAPAGMYDLAKFCQSRGENDEARAWYRKALDCRHKGVSPMAAVNLANMGSSGDPETERLLRLAATSGHPEAGPVGAVNLAMIIPGSPEERQWLEFAAESTDARAAEARVWALSRLQEIGG